MPVRDRAVEHILHRQMGNQVFDGRTGMCVSMPDEDYKTVRKEADEEFVGLVDAREVDALGEDASGRHLAIHDENKDVCGECVREALLTEDTYPDWSAR